MRKIKIDGFTFNMPDRMDAFDDAKGIGNYVQNICLMMPGTTPVAMPVYPEPRYESGTKFHRYKYGYSEPEFEGDPLVECTVGVKIWYDDKDGRGWIFNATASEPVQSIDNNWNRSMDFDTSISEMELDAQYKNKQDAETTNS